MSVVVESIGLTKKYKDFTAVNRISFQVNEGECFGILGPNGAGKTSLFKMMYGSSQITDGELFMLGMSAKEHIDRIKGVTGILPQEDGLDPDFTVYDNLLVYGSYHRIPKTELKKKSYDLLKAFHLEVYADRAVETLSGGMRRRLALARALLNDPKLLLLDEPTTGLDPQAREWVWDELKMMGMKGRTRILSTHYMEEAEVLCDRIMIVDKGSIITVGKPKELIHKYIGQEVVEFQVSPREIHYHIDRIKERYAFQVRRNSIQLHLREKTEINSVLSQIQGESVVVRKASLNDVFLKLAGYELRDE
jgi:lipooligosaccharide transport system ATP-binding protein